MLSHYIYIYTHCTSLWQPYRGMWQDYGPLVTAAEGITVAVTSLPQYIAYAELAQLSGFRGRVHGPIGTIGAPVPFQSFPPGIVASGPPLIAFAFLTGNPCLNIGVTCEEKWEARTFTVGNRSEHAGIFLRFGGWFAIHFHIQIEVAWKWGFPLMLLSSFVPNLIWFIICPSFVTNQNSLFLWIHFWDRALSLWGCQGDFHHCPDGHSGFEGSWVSRSIWRSRLVPDFGHLFHVAWLMSLVGWRFPEIQQ